MSACQRPRVTLARQKSRDRGLGMVRCGNVSAITSWMKTIFRARENTGTKLYTLGNITRSRPRSASARPIRHMSAGDRWPSAEAATLAGALLRITRSSTRRPGGRKRGGASMKRT